VRINLPLMSAESRAKRRDALVRDLIRQALALEDPSALWPIMARELIAYFACERVTIFQRRGKDRLVSRYAHGLTASVALKVGEGLAGSAAESGESVVCNDPYRDDRFDKALDKKFQFKTRNLLAFPLLYRGRAVAVLELINKDGGFTDLDLSDLSAIGSELAVLFVKFKFEEEESDLTRRMIQVEKMAAMGRLASSMAHEVNNPLTAVLGYLQIMMRLPGMPEDALRYGLKTDAEVRRIQQIVKDLLGFAREASAVREPVDVSSIAKASLDLAHTELRHRRIKIESTLPQGLPRVLGDKNQLQQVVLNLIVNSMHAMDGRPNSVLKLLSRRENGHVLVEVVDNGPGITYDAQDRVFEPFFTTKGEGKGTGLGLYVSSGIVEKHGGELSFDSRPGQGATFRLTLPAVTAKD